MSNKVIQALYNDDDVLMAAVKKVKAVGHGSDAVILERNHRRVVVRARTR